MTGPVRDGRLVGRVLAMRADRERLAAAMEREAIELGLLRRRGDKLQLTNRGARMAYVLAAVARVMRAERRPRRVEP